MVRRSGWTGIFVASSALALIAAACSSPAAAPAGPAGAPAAQPGAPAAQQPAAPGGQQAKATPQYGGKVIIGGRGTPQSMNTYDGGRDIPVTFDHFYEPLIAYEEGVDYRIDFPLVPWLAEKWEMKDDTTWDFTIRQGVKFHDGKPLTAEGVAWSLNFIRDKANGYSAASNLASVNSITVEGPNVVRLKLNNPTPGLGVALETLYMLPKHIYDAGGKDAVDTKSVGTGPFALVDFNRTSKTIFKKFPEYWGKDKSGKQLPYLDGIEVIPNMDAATQQAAFAARQLDIQVFSDKAQLDAFLKSAPDGKVQKFTYASDASLITNLERPYMNKLEVRQALQLIINRQEILANFAGGEGIFSLPVVSAMKEGYSITQEELVKRPGWSVNKAAEVAQAKKLLADAGVPADWEILFLNHATYSNGPQGEQAANQFRAAGLKVRYNPVDDVTVIKEENAGNYDVALDLMANIDPARAYNQYHSKGSSQRQRLKDPVLDDLTTKMRSTASKEELKALTKQIQKHVLDQAYILPLVAPSLYTVTQPWLMDYIQFSIQPSLSRSAARIWVDQAKLAPARK